MIACTTSGGPHDLVVSYEVFLVFHPLTPAQPYRPYIGKTCGKRKKSMKNAVKASIYLVLRGQGISPNPRRDRANAVPDSNRVTVQQDHVGFTSF